jgi:hypothetical protein
VGPANPEIPYETLTFSVGLTWAVCHMTALPTRLFTHSNNSKYKFAAYGNQTTELRLLLRPELTDTVSSLIPVPRSTI